MNPRREYVAYLIGQLLLALGVLWLANATWRVTLTETISQGLGTTIQESGADFVPFLSISAVVSIIALLGVVATGIIGRRVIGVVSALISLMAFISLFFVASEGIFVWLAVSGAFLIGLVATNVFAVVKCSRWPQLGGKYDRDSPARPRADAAHDPWKSLDNGIDPTLD